MCPPMLAHFSTAVSMVVVCDTSSVGLGACLSQLHHGVELRIAFTSRTLSAAERKYPVSEGTGLSMGLRTLNFYSSVRQFTLVTDYQTLKTLLTTGGLGHQPPRLHRWSDRLLQNSFTVAYRPGKLNVVADYLSYSSVIADKPAVNTSVDSRDDPESV